MGADGGGTPPSQPAAAPSLEISISMSPMVRLELPLPARETRSSPRPPHSPFPRRVESPPAALAALTAVAAVAALAAVTVLAAVGALTAVAALAGVARLLGGCGLAAPGAPRRDCHLPRARARRSGRFRTGRRDHAAHAAHAALGGARGGGPSERGPRAGPERVLSRARAPRVGLSLLSLNCRVSSAPRLRLPPRVPQCLTARAWEPRRVPAAARALNAAAGRRRGRERSRPSRGRRGIASSRDMGRGNSREGGGGLPRVGTWVGATVGRGGDCLE